MAQVTTIHGLMDEELLEKKVIKSEDARNFYEATEYWLDGVLVHRSAHITVKATPEQGGSSIGRF